MEQFRGDFWLSFCVLEWSKHEDFVFDSIGQRFDCYDDSRHYERLGLLGDRLECKVLFVTIMFVL